jgi:methionine aminotransferase
MASDLGAINLSQGYPDFPMDERLISLVNQYMLEGYNQYAPMPGLPELNRSIAQVVRKSYSRKIDAEKEVTVVAGGTEALFSAVAAFISAGDEVILFDPSYDSYDPSVRLNGGIPVHIELHPPAFTVDWDDVEKRITRKTRMIMINTPQNPTGAVMSEADMLSLEKLVLKYGLIVVSDEVYERIIFDGLQHQSVIRFEGLFSQSVAAFSFGKTFHATGWKVGYTVAPESLTKEIRKTHQFITFSVNTPVQKALAEYLTNPETYESLSVFYQKKRDFFLDQLRGSSFEPIASRGSYFQLVSYRSISAKSEIEMAEHLTKNFKVAAIPVSVFYKRKLDQQLLRFCFAKKEETLEKAGEILRKI